MTQDATETTERCPECGHADHEDACTEPGCECPGDADEEAEGGTADA